MSFNPWTRLISPDKINFFLFIYLRFFLSIFFMCKSSKLISDLDFATCCPTHSKILHENTWFKNKEYSRTHSVFTRLFTAMDIFESKSVQITFACVLPFISAIIFGYGSSKNMNPWYNNLKRPKICPPNWVFAPMWAYLYSSMGYASYRVWANGNGFDGIAKVPLIVYLVHLLINVTWPQTYFTFHLLGAGLIHILVLWASVIFTTFAFITVDLTAAVLFIPYIAWISLASYVTYCFWKLNCFQQNEKKSE